MAETGKPQAKGDMFCPLWKKQMRHVCHKCEWWTHIRGKNPQGEDVVDHWGCAVAWLPMMMIENSQQQRQTAASVDKFASAVHTAAADTTAMRGHVVDQIIQAINGRARTREQLTDETDNPRP
jgi:hypothetical protein